MADLKVWVSIDCGFGFWLIVGLGLGFVVSFDSDVGSLYFWWLHASSDVGFTVFWWFGVRYGVWFCVAGVRIVGKS